MRAMPCILTMPDVQVSAAVNDRILRRILTFAGLPTFLGFALFPLFYWVKVCDIQLFDELAWLGWSSAASVKAGAGGCISVRDASC